MNLPGNIRAKIIKMYFGEGGINYNLGRIHINSCDFSLESYSFDDVPGDYEVSYHTAGAFDVLISLYS
jgi:glucosylceramidase